MGDTSQHTCQNQENATMSVIQVNILTMGDQETSQELRILSIVTIKCQVTKIVMNSGYQLSEL